MRFNKGWGADLRRSLGAVLITWLSPLPAQAQVEALIAPGILVDVADTQLHLYCLGAGQPTIMLEAGLAGNFLDWSLVQPDLATTNRVCAYDRAGIGFSARSQRPRTAANITQELHLLVEAAAIERPFVLVGHSFGGMMALAYAQHYPKEVAGLVLLDTMHPEQFDLFPAGGVDLPLDPNLILGRTAGLAALYGLPKALHPLALEIAGQEKNRIFIIRELKGMVAAAHDVHAAPLPHVPARVVVHGNKEWDGPYPDGRMEALWTKMQGDLAQGLGAPPPRVVAGSGHQLALDQPVAVLEVIRALSR